MECSPISERALIFGRFPGFAHFFFWQTYVKMKRNMEQWWNDTDRGKLKFSERTLFHFHFVYHKSQTDRPEVSVVAGQ
jgi:hypothetical protein